MSLFGESFQAVNFSVNVLLAIEKMPRKTITESGWGEMEAINKILVSHRHASWNNTHSKKLIENFNKCCLVVILSGTGFEQQLSTSLYVNSVQTLSFGILWL